MPKHRSAKIQTYSLSQNRWDSVIFVDLDNTILNGPFESIVFPIIFGELSEKSGLKINEIRRLIVRENLERQQDPRVPAVVAMDWDDIVITVAGKLGVRVRISVEDLVRTYAHPPHSCILEDAQNILLKISKPHRAIVAATKGLKKYQFPVLESLGLKSLFIDILTPDTHNALKRDISFYGNWPSLTKLQISVGDHYEDDVIAPKTFGFKSIWVLRQNQNGEARPIPSFTKLLGFGQENRLIQPDVIITSLQELEEAIDQIEAKCLMSSNDQNR